MTEQQKHQVFDTIDTYRKDHPNDYLWQEIMEILYGKDVVTDYLNRKGERQ